MPLGRSRKRGLKVPKVSAHPSQALLDGDGDRKLEVECAVDKSESLTEAGALNFLVASTERLRMFRPLRPSSALEARVEGALTEPKSSRVIYNSCVDCTKFAISTLQPL
jgi:hypothetical protein